MARKAICLGLCCILLLQQSGFTQAVAPAKAPVLPLPSSASGERFRPAHLRSLGYDERQTHLELIVDRGDQKQPGSSEATETTRRLLSFFLIGISLPERSFWVNLRPDTPQEIIDPLLAQTDVGKIMLEADLQLKKDTAAATSPQTPGGKAYWDKLYRRAEELFGGSRMSFPTLSRPWIVPGEIIVRETSRNAYVYKATLKVMLEEDYIRDTSHLSPDTSVMRQYAFADERLRQLNAYAAQLMRELIIPELTRKVNTERSYAPLRQVYYALILAQWFKRRFRGAGGLYAERIDSADLLGLRSAQTADVQEYYRRYQQSFRDGEYRLQAPAYSLSGKSVRHYFSGGIQPLPSQLPAPGKSETLPGGGLYSSVDASAHRRLPQDPDRGLRFSVGVSQALAPVPGLEPSVPAAVPGALLVTAGSTYAPTASPQENAEALVRLFLGIGAGEDLAAALEAQFKADPTELLNAAREMQAARALPSLFQGRRHFISSFFAENDAAGAAGKEVLQAAAERLFVFLVEHIAQEDHQPPAPEASPEALIRAGNKVVLEDGSSVLITHAISVGESRPGEQSQDGRTTRPQAHAFGAEGVFYGLYVRDRGTRTIYLDRAGLAERLQDPHQRRAFARVLGRESFSIEDAARFLDGHETFHALVDELRLREELPEMSQEQEEALADLFGRDFAFGEVTLDIRLQSLLTKMSRLLRVDVARVLRKRGTIEEALGYLGIFVSLEWSVSGSELARLARAPAPAGERLVRPFLVTERTALTPTPNRRDNAFEDMIARSSSRSRAQVRREHQERAYRQHAIAEAAYGFIERGTHPQADIVFSIFDDVVAAFNLLAKAQGQPPYSGRLYLVDSPELDAHVPIGFEDVYISAGLIREMAHYCERSGTPFSRDLIAAIFAHELTHVLQATSFEGMDVDKWQQGETRFWEIWDIKRNMEYQADEGAMHLLSATRTYAPDAIIEVMSFLQRIQMDSTAGTTLSDHPHPKQRKANLLMKMKQASFVVAMPSRQKRQQNVLDAAVYRDFRARRHLGATALRVGTAQELIRALERAETIDEVYEAAVLAQQQAFLGRLKSFAATAPARQAFARVIFIGNVLAALDSIRMQATDDPRPGERFAPLSTAGAFLQEYVASLPYSPGDEQILLNHLGTPDGMRHFFLERMHQLQREILTHHAVSSAVKEKALRRSEELVRYFEERFEFIAAESFARFQSVSPPAEGDFSRLFAPERPIGSEALRRLEEVPFCVYSRYGKKSLDERIPAKDYAQSRGVALEGETAYLEVDDPALYTPDMRLWPAQEPLQRQRLFEGLLFSWLYQRTFSREPFAQLAYDRFEQGFPEFALEPAVAAAVYAAALRVAPDVPGESPQHNARMKEHLALLLSDPHARKAHSPQLSPGFGAYVSAVLPCLRRPILPQQLARETDPLLDGIPTSFIRALAPQASEAESLRPLYYELNNDKSAARSYILMRLTDAAQTHSLTYESARRDFADSVAGFSRTFLKEALDFSLLEQLYNRWQAHLSFSQIVAIFVEHFDYEGVIPFLPDLSQRIFSGLPATGNEAGLRDLIAVFDEAMRRRQPEDALLSANFGWAYIQAHLLLWRSDAAITPQRAFGVLDSLSRHLALTVVFHLGDYREVDPNGRALALGKLGPQDSAADLDQHQLGEEEIPFALFDRPSTMRQQLFTRQLFGLGRAQLQQLVRQQQEVLARSAEARLATVGRFNTGGINLGSSPSTLDLLNKLIIRRLLEEKQAGLAPLTPQSFRVFFKSARLQYRTSLFSKTQTPELGATIELINYEEFAASLRQAFAAEIAADSPALDALVDEIARGFACSTVLENASGDSSDAFFGALADDTPAGTPFLRRLPRFCHLLAQMEVPSKLNETVPEFSEPTDYLAALAATVATRGTRAKLFQRYEQRVDPLGRISLESPTLDEDFARKREMLQRFLPRPSLVRDGYIDLWEAQFLPELSPGFLEAMLAGGVFAGDEYIIRFIKARVIDLPRQWSRLQQLDMRMSAERAERLCAFYAQVIPLVADPQKQIRFGATALKIFLAAHPSAGFHEERAAILRFFPLPSRTRDDLLDGLIDTHTIPSPAVPLAALQETRLQYTQEQRGGSNQEFLLQDTAEQLLKNILSGLSRKDRKETLLWFLTPGKRPEPGCLKDITKRTNIVFGNLPQNLRLAPPEFRERFLVEILLGENGLFEPRTDEERNQMRSSFEALFEHYFPAPRRWERAGFSRSEYAVFRDIFLLVMEHIDPAKRTAIVLSMMSVEGELANFSTGERLATVLSAFGPVGVKVGQILCENGTIIQSESLRRSLGSLRDEAEPFSKAGVLNALVVAAPELLGHIRIGRRLGSASMKQVHEGEYERSPGEWVPVVIKVLRPLVNRQIDEDMRVLRSVLEALREKYPHFPIGALDREIEDILREEMDFGIEAENTLGIGRSLDAVPAQEVTVRVPQVLKLVRDENAMIIVEEKVRGLEFSRLWRARTLRERLQQEAASKQPFSLQALMTERGLSPAEQTAFLALRQRRSALVAQIRSRFLRQIFEEGFFHADLHQGNVMITPEGTVFFIDSGLAGRLSPEERLAAADLVKGVLLRQPQRVCAAVEALLGAQPDPDFAKAVSAALGSWQNIHQTFKAILSAMLAHSHGNPKRKTTVRFLKAFMQGLWLFPDDLAGVSGSFSSLAEAVGMTPAQRRAALVAQARAQVLFRLRDGAGIAALLASYPFRWAHAALRRSLRLKAGVEQLGGLRSDAVALQVSRWGSSRSDDSFYQKGGPLSEDVLALELSVDENGILLPLRLSGEGAPGDNATVSNTRIDRIQQASGAPRFFRAMLQRPLRRLRGIPPEAPAPRRLPRMQSAAAYMSGLSAQRREELILVCRTYRAFCSVVEGAYQSPHWAEEPLMQRLAQYEFGRSFSAIELVSRVLTRRYLQARGEGGVAAEMLAIYDPVLRRLSEDAADMLMQYDAFLVHSPRAVGRQYWYQGPLLGEVFAGTGSLDSIKTTAVFRALQRNSTGLALHTDALAHGAAVASATGAVYPTSEQGQAPSFVRSPFVLEELGKLTELSPNEPAQWRFSSFAHLILSVQRVSYGERGGFSMSVLHIPSSTRAAFFIPAARASDFLRGSFLPEARITRYRFSAAGGTETPRAFGIFSAGLQPLAEFARAHPFLCGVALAVFVATPFIVRLLSRWWRGHTLVPGSSVRESPSVGAPSFAARLNSADASERLRALQELRHQKSLAAQHQRDLVRILLNETDPRLRSAAAVLLQAENGNAADSVKALIQALRSDDLFIQAAAVQTLAAFGPAAQEAVPHLEAMDYSVAWQWYGGGGSLLVFHKQVQEAINRITGRFEDPEETFRRDAKHHLGDQAWLAEAPQEYAVVFEDEAAAGASEALAGAIAAAQDRATARDERFGFVVPAQTILSGLDEEARRRVVGALASQMKALDYEAFGPGRSMLRKWTQERGETYVPALLQNPSNDIFLLFQGGELTGFAIGQLDPRNKTAYLARLATRGRDLVAGRGTFLMDTYFSRLRERGIRLVQWKCRKDALGFYEQWLRIRNEDFSTRMSEEPTGIFTEFSVDLTASAAAPVPGGALESLVAGVSASQEAPFAVDLAEEIPEAAIAAAIRGGRALRLDFNRSLKGREGFGLAGARIAALGRAIQAHFGAAFDARYLGDLVIEGLVSNALVWGNNLQPRYPAYLLVEPQAQRISVFDCALEPKMDRAVASVIAKRFSLSGEGKFIEVLGGQWRYERVPLVDASGKQVGVRASVERAQGRESVETPGRSGASGASSLAAGSRTPGGIDLRALPIVIQPVVADASFVPVSARGFKDAAEQERRIQKLLESGLVPSTARLRSCAAASCTQQDADAVIERILLCIARIFELEEERCCMSEQALRELLHTLEAAHPAEELRLLLSASAAER